MAYARPASLFSMIRSSILGKAAPTQPIAVKCIGCSNWKIWFTVSTRNAAVSVTVEISYNKPRTI
jgi:ribosomal protein S27E